MEEILTVEEVAEFLKVSRDTVYRLTQQGKIPATKVGNQWRFTKTRLLEWLNSGGEAVLKERDNKKGS